MFASSQDVFASCGFDCQINIYDTRKRSKVHQWAQPSPLSTICVSVCGAYCVTGNLKGEISSFDFRNMSEAVETKRLHESSVVRVAFIPSNATEFNTPNDDINITNMELEPAHGSQDASNFLNFVDHCKFNQMDVDEDELCTPKENVKENSWDDLLRSRQQANEFSMLDSPGVKSGGNMPEQRLARTTLLRLSGSPINGLSHSAITATPKSANSKSALLISTPLSFEEPSSVELVPVKPTESKPRPALHRRSSFGEEFKKCLKPTNMSTPVLRTQSPKKLKHIIHDVIEEESLTSQASLMASKCYGSQLEEKENQQNNYQNPPVINSNRTAHPSPQHKQVNDIFTASNIEIPDSVKVKDGIISMSTGDFAAIINAMKCDMEKELKSNKIHRKYLAKDIADIAHQKLIQTCQAEIIQIKEINRGRLFGAFFQLRMYLRFIETAYEKLLNYTPTQLADKLPILRQEWKVMNSHTRGVSNNSNNNNNV